ncbi:MAG: HEAT repeat domain-containing protein [Verrucomicrobia bacterium]|nr:HEAT repeat domain-containing protein [Verrucomicrobiota bacterium]
MLWWTARQLKADDWKAREAAAKKLAEVRDAAAIDALVGALKDTNARVRQAAAGALVKIGPSAVPALIAILKAKHRETRQAAAETLARIGDPAVGPLGSVVLEKDLVARETAAAALGEIGTELALSQLLIALEQGDTGAKEAAAAGLVRIGPQAIQPLIAKLSEPKTRVRETAAAALVRIGRPAIQPLISALQNSSAREAAIEVLGKIDANWGQSAAAKEALPSVVESLKGEDERLRRTAAGVLGQLGGARALEPLLAALADANSGVQEAAASALAEIGDPRALVPLIAALKHGDAKARKAVAAALVRISNSLVHPLVEALKSKEAAVREAAAAVLVQVGNSVIEPLVDALCKIDPNWSRSEGAKSTVPQFVSALKDAGSSFLAGPKESLRHAGGTRVITPLIATLKDMQNGLGKASLSQIQIKNSRDVEALTKALEKEDAAVRKSALQALLDIGSESEEPLAAALSSKNHVIRRAAAHALAERHDPRARDVLRCDLMDTSELVMLDAAESLLKTGDVVIVLPLVKLLKQLESSPADPETSRAHIAARILRLLRSVLDGHAKDLELEDLEAIADCQTTGKMGFVPSTSLKMAEFSPEGNEAASSKPEGLITWSDIREFARREISRRRAKR